MLLIKCMLLRFSKNYHSKKVVEYWGKAPKTHYSEEESQYKIYARELAKLISRYCGSSSVRILDHGAGEGSVAVELKNILKDSEICASEKFESYRLVLQKRGLLTFDADNLPVEGFDVIYMNCAFYYIHPRLWEYEINRLLTSVKKGGYLLLTDVPTVRKIPLSRDSYRGFKKQFAILFSKLTKIYQPDLGGFYVDERKIKQLFPQTIIEDEWCPYRSVFVIEK